MNNKPTATTNVSTASSEITTLVAYQTGSIVSRPIIKHPGGAVTVFAFAEGQALSEHTSPFDALVQILEGEAEITISDKSHRLAAGTLILMPAAQPHAVKAIGPFKMLLTLIRP